MAEAALLWLSAAAIEALVGYFAGSAGEALINWAGDLPKIADRSKTPKGDENRDLHDGMSALSKTIRDANAEERERIECVLQTLIELNDSFTTSRQNELLHDATNALSDLHKGRYSGADNPKKVELLETAYKSAQKAARFRGGHLSTKLMAYRIWFVTSYMHEAKKNSCQAAKHEALFIIGELLRDENVLKICNDFTLGAMASGYRSAEGASDTATVISTSSATTRTPSIVSRSYSRGVSNCGMEGVEVIEFLFEILSSVLTLPPLDQDLSVSRRIEVLGAGTKEVKDGKLELIGGRLVLGPDADPSIALAMGRYCASEHRITIAYPYVSALVLFEWGKSKERLALNNFFESTGGVNWLINAGWVDNDGNFSSGELCGRYGIAVEAGHVTKISLACNNLTGTIEDDLADCEHLRELSLHGNNISGVLPKRVRELIVSRRIVVTGFEDIRQTQRQCDGGSAARGPLRRSSSTDSSLTECSVGSKTPRGWRRRSSQNDKKRQDPEKKRGIRSFVMEALKMSGDFGGTGAFSSVCEECKGPTECIGRVWVCVVCHGDGEEKREGSSEAQTQDRDYS